MLNDGGLTIRTTLDLTASGPRSRRSNDYIPTGDPSGRVAAIAMSSPEPETSSRWLRTCATARGPAAS